jgi:hypothetical protein
MGIGAFGIEPKSVQGFSFFPPPNFIFALDLFFASQKKSKLIIITIIDGSMSVK